MIFLWKWIFVLLMFKLSNSTLEINNNKTKLPASSSSSSQKSSKLLSSLISSTSSTTPLSKIISSTTLMDDLILSRPKNLHKKTQKNSKFLENHNKNHNNKLNHHKPNVNIDDIEDEDEDDDDDYYDKSDGEDSDYQEGEYDENPEFDLSFNTFGKQLIGDGLSDDTLPIFLVEPQSTYVIRNKPAALSCKAAHALELMFRCSGNVQPTPTNHDSHVDPHTGIRFLEISTEITRNLVDEFFGSGPFQCECFAMSPRGHIKSQPAVIEVSYIKKLFSESPSSIRVEIGTRAEIHCSPPLAIPMPNITWLKNGASLHSGQSVTVLDDHGLIFPHVTIQDMGNYTCVAENIAGRRVTEAALLNVFADGGWSQWGPWTECKCQGKQNNGQKRSRTCTNPSPLNGGSPCVGVSVQKTQDCVICQSGRWSNWSEWSMCGFDCIQTRRRSCLSLETHYQSFDDDSTTERVQCFGRDFQSTECRGGGCHIDRDDTDWPLYAGLAIIIVVCIGFGGILSYGANKRRHLSPYTATRTEIINPNNLDGKPIGYGVAPQRTMVTSSNYSYPLSRGSIGKHGLLSMGRPASEHLYDEPHITANYPYPQNPPGIDKSIWIKE